MPERKESLTEERYPYIAVVGGMGAGKTTFTKLVADRWGVHHFEEEFLSNPFWEAFNRNPTEPGISFKSEITFLVRKPQQVKGLSELLNKTTVLHDTVWAQDRSYGRVHRKKEWMTKEEYKTYQLASEALLSANSIPEPDIFLALLASGETLRRRVIERAVGNPEREPELTLVTNHPEYFDYLAKGVEILARLVRIKKGPEALIEVDTEKYDFANNPDHQEFIIGEIAHRIGRGIFIINNRGIDNLQLKVPSFCIPKSVPESAPGLPAYQKMLQER